MRTWWHFSTVNHPPGVAVEKDGIIYVTDQCLVVQATVVSGPVSGLEGH
jgi:hypothetical protein